MLEIVKARSSTFPSFTSFAHVCIALVNDDVLIMPMIETREGVENVEAIAAVPGIDALFIGCADLCMELAVPGQHDSEFFHSTVAKIANAAEKASVDGRKVSVGLGGLEPRPDLLEALAKRHASIR
ncbi:HpcH/HpaI aldolase [Colletotrichum abscissum]|uniref:HpcH/HpaI aldolase n=1 Tax=Colletotrichum abscissum TaxID=1671311 RepID=A0A9P9XAK6_9PEZI|nr:HpcH/HpaI aldolase [Colletotrichum abscissum]KAI3543264.1 HpcH/HpaI aldolase [Colletotrichum abscissum]KAK1496941.1 HpcH/HpaI aldolase [Colletotrichum abscissum]